MTRSQWVTIPNVSRSTYSRALSWTSAAVAAAAPAALIDSAGAR